MKRLSIMTVLVAQLGCSADNPAFDPRTNDTGTGDGDQSTSEGGEDQSTGNGDGDGDPVTGDGDGDPHTGDGDGDPNTGDGDGEPMACAEPMTQCGNGCTNVDIDPMNCGGCDFNCVGGDACEAGLCGRERVMFVTQARFNGGLLGVLGADAKCNVAATENFDEPKMFWSWNSAAVVSPANRFMKDGHFVRTDGELIARSWPELTSGALLNPIDHQEAGVAIEPSEACDPVSQVWTGTAPDGGLFGPTCGNWIDVTNLTDGVFGNLHATDEQWTVATPQCQENPRCSAERRLYCLEL